MFNAQAFRAQFPLFKHPDNQQLIYFDNAATTQKPAMVIDAMADYYQRYNANAHRAGHRLGRLATGMVEECRQLAADFVGARSADEVIFTRGATESLNLLAYALGQSIQPGDEILLTSAEHHANLVPWQQLAQNTGANLVFLPAINGVPDFSRLAEHLSNKTRIFSCTAASNVLGFSAPLELIRQTLQNRGVVWILDAAQRLAHGPMMAADIGCDYLVGSAHKFYGPSGIGLLWGRRESLQSLPVWQTGGQMVEAVQLNSASFQSAPLRFEAGTPALAAQAGLRACFQFWQQHNVAALRAYEQSLVTLLIDGLSRHPAITVLSVTGNNIGVVSFVVDELNGDDIALWLDQSDIAVRAGQHCASPLLQLLGEEQCLRASVCAYNTADEIERFIVVLNQAITELQSASRAAPTAQTTDALREPDLSTCDLQVLYQANSWQRKYKLLMTWSQVLPCNSALRDEQNRVSGCEAKTWLQRQKLNGRFYFYIDSEARVVRGLAVLLLLHVQAKRGDEILAWDIDAVFTQLNLQRHLSSSRVNGLMALWRAMIRGIDE